MTEVLDDIIKLNINKLDEAKIHTQYKIKYVSKYVEKWLLVCTKEKNYDTINFIDSMCNAGIYSNGIKGTCIEVLDLFYCFAKKFPNKKFNVYLNDIDTDKIRILKQITGKYNLTNLKLHITNMDVVYYLNYLVDNKVLNNRSFILLYNDPYNFGIQKLLPTIKKFINYYYCELMFNFFSSDIRRNKENKSSPRKMEAIKEELTSIITNIEKIDDENLDLVRELTVTYKNTRYIKYAFAYRFNNTRNAELYYIVFFTPHKKGLALLKETIWDVFNGEESFKKQIDVDKQQLKLFDTDIYLINAYSESMKKEILELIKINKYVGYDLIETYVLENSLLKQTQVINNIIKPLIEEGKIEKIIPLGLKQNNFKDCSYKYIDSN